MSGHKIIEGLKDALAGNYTTTRISPEEAKARAEKYRWRGEGPEPAWWFHADGTKVYRSYEDYCDD